MTSPRPIGRSGKRVRADEFFFSDVDAANSGSYLRIKLSSGKPVKNKGWPWVQLGVRGILGTNEKLDKASFLNDGSLLVKTKHEGQTGKLLNIKKLVDEECVVEKDKRLNVSRGTIHAFDLIDLTESEVVGWLKDFGVVEAKRFVKTVNRETVNTPTILLTFEKPSCPTKLELDYTTYHVHQYIPNPLLCRNCGRFGHPEGRCENDQICLQCGQSKHEASQPCTQKCVNCKKVGHSCLARDCEVWKREKEICRIKVEQELSYIQAKKQYEKTHEPPVLKAYSTVTRTPSVAQKHEEGLKAEVGSLKTQVGMLEKKLGEMMTLLEKVLKQPEVPKLPAEELGTSKQPMQRTETEKTTEDHEMSEVESASGSGVTEPHRSRSLGRKTDGAVGNHQSKKAQVGGKPTKTAGKKERERSKVRNTEPGDEMSPSPVFQRPVRHTEQHAGKPPETRQSWITDE